MFFAQLTTVQLPAVRCDKPLAGSKLLNFFFFNFNYYCLRHPNLKSVGLISPGRIGRCLVSLAGRLLGEY